MLKGIGKALEQADIDIYLIVDGIYRVMVVVRDAFSQPAAPSAGQLVF